MEEYVLYAARGDGRMAHRIEEMADRSEEEAKSAAGKEPFESLIPLKEVIAMAMDLL